MAHSSHMALKTLACLVSTGLGTIAGFNYVSSGNVLHTSGQPGLDTPIAISPAVLDTPGETTVQQSASVEPAQTDECDQVSGKEITPDSCCTTPASRASVLIESGDAPADAMDETNPSEG